MARLAVPRQHLSVTGVVVLAALLLAVLGGCSANDSTTTGAYPPTDGSDTELDGVRAGNLILLTSAEGASGTLLGYLTNSGTRSTGVSLGLSDGASLGPEVQLRTGATVLLGPDGDIELGLESVPAPPGAYVSLRMTTGSGSVTVPVPVLDGTLPQYADLVPTDD